MKLSTMRWVVSAAMAAALGGGAAYAQTEPSPLSPTGTEALSAARPKKKSGKPAKTAKAAKRTVKFMPSSAETPGERASRLQRECKGRVNAGACEGYAN